MLVEGIRTVFAEWQATHHSITNHQIRIDGDVAVIRAHVHAQHWLPPDEAVFQRNRWLVVGFYDDEAVRTPEGWRLSKVRLTPVYQEHPQRLADPEHEAEP